MSASDDRSVMGQNVANVPSLVVILEQLGWRVFNDRRRLSRLDLRIDEAEEKNRPTASLETEKGKLQEQLVRFDELLDDCAEWIRVRTGIPKRKIRDVAISTAINEGKHRDDIYAKLGKLDECGQTANLWTALVSQDRDALESVRLLPSIDSNPPALETGRQVGLADGGTSSPKAPTEERSKVAGDESGKTDCKLTGLNSMRRLSNGWRIDWQDDKGIEGGEVDDLKGFAYIAQLVAMPHVSVPTVRLLGIEFDPIALSDQHSVQPTWDSATERDADEMASDLEAKLQRLNKECQDALSEGDDAAYRDSNAVRETTISELVELRRTKAGAIKPNGEPRELNNPFAKQHESVRGAIRRAVKRLDAKKLKRLAMHFDTFAKPDNSGSAFVYCPDSTVTWNVEAATPTG